MAERMGAGLHPSKSVQLLNIIRSHFVTFILLSIKLPNTQHIPMVPKTVDPRIVVNARLYAGDFGSAANMAYDVKYVKGQLHVPYKAALQQLPSLSLTYR